MVSTRNSSKADVEIHLFPKLFLMLVQVVVSLSGPILADFSTNNKHGSSVYLKLNFCTSAQWESALEVRGQIEHSSNYFTIWNDVVVLLLIAEEWKHETVCTVSQQ